MRHFVICKDKDFTPLVLCSSLCLTSLSQKDKSRMEVFAALKHVVCLCADCTFCDRLEKTVHFNYQKASKKCSNLS